jgi:hypothetical protein
LGGWDWSSFISSFGTLLNQLQIYTPDAEGYLSIHGADGNLHSMTGLLILPSSISGGAKPSVPILMYQHGTEVYRPFSPSQYLTHLGSPANYPEVMVAAAIAATGYAVAMVDYEGMGDNTDPAAPCRWRRTRAAGYRYAQGKPRHYSWTSSSPCSWNNQLFLMGYSEGGYVTMVATRGTAAK